MFFIILIDAYGKSSEPRQFPIYLAAEDKFPLSVVCEK